MLKIGEHWGAHSTKMHLLLLYTIAVSFFQGLVRSDEICRHPPVIMTDFLWHNSIHNCGCDDTGCLPPCVAPPPGCGPPDILRANIYEPEFGYNVSCVAQDPGTVPAGGIPGGPYCCDKLGTRLLFTKGYGGNGIITFIDSNKHCSNPPSTSSSDNWEVTYTGYVDLNCLTDMFGNRTCYYPDEVSLQVQLVVEH